MIVIVEVLFFSDCGVETTTRLRLSSGVVVLELETVTTSLVLSIGFNFSSDSLKKKVNLKYRFVSNVGHLINLKEANKPLTS